MFMENDDRLQTIEVSLVQKISPLPSPVEHDHWFVAEYDFSPVLLRAIALKGDPERFTANVLLHGDLRHANILGLYGYRL